MTDIDDLVRCITALLELDKHKALVPHGLPAVAREYLTDAAAALERLRDELAHSQECNSHMEYTKECMAEQIGILESQRDAAESEVARMREALREAYAVLASAFNRIHVLPRSSDTELATKIEKVRSRIEAALAQRSE